MSVSPILVTGMHRSGTTLLTRHLIRSGVFMGAFREHNEEARFFLSLNRRLLRGAGARWDRPAPLSISLADRRELGRAVEACSGAWRSWRALRYTGLGRRRHILEGHWGFKDPRTVFTAAVWLGVFPDARIVMLFRNGVDVAVSLRRRELNPPRFHRIARDGSVRCRELDGGFALWCEYVEAGMALLDSLPEGRGVPVRYEDYVADPGGVLGSVLRRLGVDGPHEGTLETKVADTRAPGAGGVAPSAGDVEKLSKRAARHPLMQRLGYGSVEPSGLSTRPERKRGP